MKRFLRHSLVMFSILLTPLLLGACQSSDLGEGIKIDDVPLDRRIGTISTLGNVQTSSGGTHLLRLDDGDTILLKSLSINLDDEKYRSRVVEVRGILTYTKGDKPLMEVMNIDILENYKPQNSRAAGWKTYEGVLFSIRYRDDFILEKSANGVSFTLEIEPEEGSTQETAEDELLKDVISIEFSSKEEDETLAEFIGLREESPSELLEAGLSRSKIGSQNLDALKKTLSDGVMFYVEGDANFFTISFVHGDHPDAGKNENLFYDMLSSFSLGSGEASMEENLSSDALESRTLELDSEEDLGDEPADDPVDEEPAPVVTGYETFASSSVGFSVQYPKSWYFEGQNSSEPGVLQVYNFSDEPLDEGGDVVVKMSIATKDSSSGEVSAQGTTFGKTTTGNTVEITYRGDGRYFVFSGPISMEDTLITMAASVDEE